MRPVVAPTGTVALICAEDTTVKLAVTPLNATDVAPPKPLPLMVTIVPTGPLAGENEDTTGGPMTVNELALCPVPAAVVTLIRPVVAPAGTVALICADDTTVKLAEAPLNATDVAPLKPLPLMVTVVPTGPLVGENDEISGTPVTVNDPELCPVPPAVVTLIRPVVAPAGTVALICAEDTTVKLAEVPLNLTDVAPLKPLPLIVTVVPTGPLAGENDEITGGLVTVKKLVL